MSISLTGHTHTYDLFKHASAEKVKWYQQKHFTSGFADRLQFVGPRAGEPVQTFTYGLDILALEIGHATPVRGAVMAIGEGAAGSQGQDAWSWVVKDASGVRGRAGDGPSERLTHDASLRSLADAQRAADSMAAAAQSLTATGTLMVPGAPAVTVASTIEIVDAPHESLNGRFLVTQVRHQFSRRRGFTTVTAFCRVPDGAGGLP